VTAVLLDREGIAHARTDRATVESRLTSGEFFWLDLDDPDEDEYRLLHEVFAFHPLAVEDSVKFGQRPKLEDYEDFAFLVLYGAAPPPDEDRLVEVHCFYSERFLVTVRKEHAPACHLLRERYAKRPGKLARPAVLLYQLLDALVDSFFPALADFDERIDALQDEIIRDPSERELTEIFEMRRRLVVLRRAVTPQRDLVGQFTGGIVALPGVDREAERYFRDVYDHLIRVSDLIDSYRDLLTNVMDVYLSTVSNRLNEVMKRLTVIATVALPLVVITSFFGQNFGFLVDHISGWPEFLAYAVLLPLAGLILLALYLRRRRLW
jgi:magnesium transporter